MTQEKKKNVYVLLENYPMDHEIYINTFSNYEKAKEKFDYILNIWKEDGYFDYKKKGDYILDDNLCHICDTGTTLELFESDVDKFVDFNH